MTGHVLDSKYLHSGKPARSGLEAPPLSSVWIQPWIRGALLGLRTANLLEEGAGLSPQPLLSQRQSLFPKIGRLSLEKKYRLLQV